MQQAMSERSQWFQRLPGMRRVPTLELPGRPRLPAMGSGWRLELVSIRALSVSRS